MYLGDFGVVPKVQGRAGATEGPPPTGMNLKIPAVSPDWACLIVLGLYLEVGACLCPPRAKKACRTDVSFQPWPERPLFPPAFDCFSAPPQASPCKLCVLLSSFRHSYLSCHYHIVTRYYYYGVYSHSCCIITAYRHGMSAWGVSVGGWLLVVVVRLPFFFYPKPCHIRQEHPSYKRHGLLLLPYRGEVRRGPALRLPTRRKLLRGRSCCPTAHWKSSTIVLLLPREIVGEEVGHCISS